MACVALLFIAPAVYAETTRTASTETTCLDGLCTKTLYSGSMFMQDVNEIYDYYPNVTKAIYDNGKLKIKWNNTESLDNEIDLETVVFTGGEQFEPQDFPDSMNYTIDIENLTYQYKYNISFNLPANDTVMALDINTDFDYELFDTYVVIGLHRFGFEDALEDNFNISIATYNNTKISKDIIRINITKNWTYFNISVNDSVVVDPTLNLDGDTILDDSYVDSGYPDTTYGSASSLYFSNSTTNTTRAYFKYNISAIDASMDISLVQFRILHSEGTGQSFYIFHVYNQTWSEDTLTWNNQPCGVNFTNSTNCNLTYLDKSPGNVGHSFTFEYYDVTNATLTDYNAGKDNSSYVVLISPDTEYLHWTWETTSYLKIYYTESIYPTYSDITINDTLIKVNESVLFSALWADDTELNYYWFSWNNSGSWVNESAVSMSGTSAWSNITQKVTSTQGIEIGWRIYVNDTSGNINVTDIQNFTVANTEPTVSGVVIDPTPAEVTDDLNCSTYTYYDEDGDAESTQFFQWYVNGVANHTTRVLYTGNFSVGDDVICSVLVNDATDNSTSWSNSSTLTIGDTTAPVFYSQTMSTTTGQITTAFTIGINITETNVFDWVYVEITNPAGSATNYTMTEGTTNTTDYYYNKSYTPATVGTYSFNFYARDGSSNIGNYTGTQNYTATSIPVSVPPGGGGAAPPITCNYDYYCDFGETISTCPNDCTFPLILKPAGANITAYFGYSVVKSMTVYNNVSWDIENVELWFEGTENDTETFKLALFEIGTIRNTTIKSTIKTKGPITTGFYYFNLISELPENVTSGQYYIVIKAQNIEERYLVNVRTQDIEVPRNFFIILVIAGVILIAIKLISG